MKTFGMIENNYNAQACNALQDLLDTSALEARIDLCTDITDKILSGDDFSDAELLDYVRSFHALRKQFEIILKGKKNEREQQD